MIFVFIVVFVGIGKEASLLSEGKPPSAKSVLDIFAKAGDAAKEGDASRHAEVTKIHNVACVEPSGIAIVTRSVLGDVALEDDASTMT